MSQDEATPTWDDIVAAVADEVDGCEGSEACLELTRELIEESRVLDWEWVSSRPQARANKLFLGSRRIRRG